MSAGRPLPRLVIVAALSRSRGSPPVTPDRNTQLFETEVMHSLFEAKRAKMLPLMAINLAFDLGLTILMTVMAELVVQESYSQRLLVLHVIVLVFATLYVSLTVYGFIERIR